MANNFDGNPLRCDTAATVISTTPENALRVQCMEWISETAAAGGALAAADDLKMTINGVPIEPLAVIALTQTWVTSFHVPIRVHELTVSVIEGGALIVWLA